MKKIKKNKDDIWIPDRCSMEGAFKKTTHVGIGAHADDLEIIAFDGIIKHFQSKKNNFFGILLSNNRGKPIHPKYRNYPLSKVQKIRKEEQKKAARIGEYAGLAFLDYPSSIIKNPFYRKELEEKIKELIELLRPSVIYTHNLADRHPTHVAVALRVIGALRKLPKNKRPAKIYGVEVWGGLDWLLEKDKVILDVSGYEELASKLLKVFHSQIFGTHRYDIATISRRKTNAIYHKTHKFSKSTSLIYAMDLTSLMKRQRINIKNFLKNRIGQFSKGTFSTLNKLI